MYVSFVFNCNLLYIGLNLKSQLSIFMYLLKFKVRSSYNVQFIGICTVKGQNLLFLYICFMSFVTFKFPFLPYPIFRFSVSLYFIFIFETQQNLLQEAKESCISKISQRKINLLYITLLQL